MLAISVPIVNTHFLYDEDYVTYTVSDIPGLYLRFLLNLRICIHAKSYFGRGFHPLQLSAESGTYEIHIKKFQIHERILCQNPETFRDFPPTLLPT